MKRTSWIVMGLGALSVAACQVTGPATGPAEVIPETSGEVLFAPLVLQREGYCVVGFGVTYPEDVVPHKRQIRVTTLWSGDVVDYPLPIPPLGAPDSFAANDDGTITFSGMVNDSIMECEPELAARTLSIGPCAKGACSPARFLPDENSERLGLTDTEY